VKTVYPDTWAIFSDGQQFLFDIKPEDKLQKLVKDEEWRLRTMAIEEYCKERRWRYQIITDRKLDCTRLDNIEKLLNAAKHFLPSRIEKDTGEFNSLLERFLGDTGKIFKEVVDYLTPQVPLDRGEVISLLKYKIYYQHLYIDWNVPLERTILSLWGKDPLTIYALPENEKDEEKLIGEREHVKKKPRVMTEYEKQMLEKRLDMIEPLINRFGKEGTRSGIEQFCKNNNLKFWERYKKYLAWKKDGEEGLKPKPRKGTRHSKSHIDDPRVVEFMEEFINNWNEGGWQDITAAHEEFSRQCVKERGLKPPCRTTFGRHVKRLKSVENTCNLDPSKQVNVPRGLSGKADLGHHPGMFIQMDHTIVDLRLVDDWTEEDYERAWITLGIDTWSRNVWTYMISFDHPSQETVVQAILRGLMPVEWSEDWKRFELDLLKEGKDPSFYSYPCHGFPSILQVDNAMEFRANKIKDFSRKMNITLEYRPVGRSDYGGYIETFWKTFNTAIRNSKFAGRVFPRPKGHFGGGKPKIPILKRYDARKEAVLLLDDLNRWFFRWLVCDYSVNPRAGQKHCPNDLWRDGTVGARMQPMGGSLYFVPRSKKELYEYQSKLSHHPTLTPKGFRWKNIHYSSPWLRAARKNEDGLLEDGKAYEIKVTKRDVRYAWMLHPYTNEIKQLTGYKYEGDGRIHDLLMNAVGEFPVELKLIEILNDLIGTGETNWEGKSIMADFTDELIEKGKLTKKKRKVIHKMMKTGRILVLIKSSKR
jgi:putative transposase